MGSIARKRRGAFGGEARRVLDRRGCERLPPQRRLGLARAPRNRRDAPQHDAGVVIDIGKFDPERINYRRHVHRIPMQVPEH